MGILLTDEEKRLVSEGKLDPATIMEHRKMNPVSEAQPDELDQVKQEIKETNIQYKEAIQKNKDLYEELQENRKHKEELRVKIAELRKRKKELLGTD